MSESANSCAEWAVKSQTAALVAEVSTSIFNCLDLWVMYIVYASQFLILIQIVRREGLNLWQELLPTLVSLASNGPIQVNQCFLTATFWFLFSSSSNAREIFFLFSISPSWLQWCWGGFLKILLFTMKIWKVEYGLFPLHFFSYFSWNFMALSCCGDCMPIKLLPLYSLIIA